MNGSHLNSEGDIFTEYSPAMEYFYRIFSSHWIFLQNIPLKWDIFTEYSPAMEYFYRIFPCYGISFLFHLHQPIKLLL